MSHAAAPPYDRDAMDSTVFISFSSKDRAAASAICEALENRGIGCWISTRNIRPGENFQVAIVRAIRAAKVMVLVFSANSNNSDEIKKEIVLAGQARLVVIPVRVEDVAPDEAFAYEFATRQWVDLFEDWERSIQTLVEQLAEVAGVAPQARTTAPPEEAGHPQQAARAASRSRMPLLFGVAGGGVALLAAAAVWIGVIAPRPAADPSVAAKRADLVAPKPTDLVAPKPADLVAPKPADLTPPKPPEMTVADLLAKAESAEERRDYGDAADGYQKAANQGSAEAQTKLCEFYFLGRGVSKDFAQSMHWCRLAADQGNARAERHIGFLYERGLGVPEDYVEARSWFEKAAAQGDLNAETDLGLMYEEGWGVPKDQAGALRWFHRAADQGFSGAQNQIGRSYQFGMGVPRDYVEAMRWFRLAADQGHAAACYNIGLLYAGGLGVERDPAEARAWMEKAAERGFDDARRWLASHPQ